ncbi:MAG: hypothetical protein KJ067_14065 [Vicinamibacteria bacterium]|nr:hypothetical protein [Vicinamibacteria bacterium]
MASADQLKALLDSFVERDDQRFFSVAMQVAAHEARLGHGKLAVGLRVAIDQAKSRRGAAGGPSSPVPIARPRGELAGLLAVSYPGNRLVQMVLAEDLEAQITRVLREQRHAGRILEYGLAPRRKPLLVGPPGTGKTMTALLLRFDDVLHYELPSPKQIAALLRTCLGHVFGQRGRVAEARPPRDGA